MGYKFTIFCPHCNEEFKTNELKLPFTIQDILSASFLSNGYHDCYYNVDNILDFLKIEKVEEIHHCNCSRCTGLPSVEDYYKEEDLEDK